MEKIDARKLTPRELAEKRKIVIKLREKGMSNREVAKIVGISEQTTSIYYSRYKKKGIKFLKSSRQVVPKAAEMMRNITIPFAIKFNVYYGHL